MRFLEQDLEEIIYTADRAELSDRGLGIEGKLYRQVKIGNYGIADLISIERIPAYAPDGAYEEDGRLIVTIYELKKEKISVSTFLQALRYARGVERYFNFKGYNFDFELKISLIGKKLDTESSFCYLPEFMKEAESGNWGTLELITYNYGIAGISFNNHRGFCLINEGFEK